jgi:glycosyltransferase involved in cell wall biosynthesis
VVTVDEPDLAGDLDVTELDGARAIFTGSDDAAARLADAGVAGTRVRVLRPGAPLTSPVDRGALLDALNHELGASAADLDRCYLALIGHRPIPPLPAPRLSLPVVTVVVPTFNRRDLVVQTVDALLSQTYPRDLVQIVVVDDGSTDGTAEVLRDRYGESIEVAHPSAKGFAAGARNVGIERAKGEIVAFTDDDCRPEPDWLAAIVAGFGGGVALVQGRTIADPDQPRGRWARTITTPREFGLYETANLAVRRSALAALGDQPFNPAVPGELRRVIGRRLGSPGIGEDVDLGWRVRRLGVTQFATHAVVRHHVFDGSPWTALRDAVRAAGFPLLVRRVPELRREFLWARVFLTAGHAGLVLAVVAVVLAVTVSPYAVLGVAPYLWLTVRPDRPGLVTRMRRAPFNVLRDVLELAGCVAGSIYSRQLVI